MSAYVIAQFDVHDVDTYYEYASKLMQMSGDFGGKLRAANDAEVVEGSIPHLRTIIAEFDSMAQARKWYDSPEYQAIIGLRHKSTTGHLFMVEGMTMPPRTTPASE